MSSPPPDVLATKLRLQLFALVASVLLHLFAASPWLAWSEFTAELDTPGDEGPGGPVGDGGAAMERPAGPVQVSVYREAKPQRKASTAPRKSSGAAAQKGSGEEGGGDGAEAEVEADQGSAGSGPVAVKEGTPGKPPRGRKKPCEPIDEIVQLGPDKWSIERDVLDWYAGHLKELQKQVGLSSHRGDDGKRDGARLYLPRCSVLRQGGMKNGDIVHRVNGRKVNTIAQGVTTWLAVRNDKTIKVEFTRRGGEELTYTYRIKK
ncbi:MAG: hypothetical protein H6742_19975 [Alphaproteobacteria bacterium]|nr:hypothetical protein [Alphaproteobacteria bacterium]